ncbi:hypothetical protein [Geotalea uraniireducens]|uniref:hypothetical protein n=1 Tax=Geotalea uraniireducens TaxID=351604 RepID=UPI0002E3AB2C|nr:hypothetical protein [Geotalea uraniireducens]
MEGVAAVFTAEGKCEVTAMADRECTCGNSKPAEVCRVCRDRENLQYWCESCEQAVVEKRCPLCGLKARKL